MIDLKNLTIKKAHEALIKGEYTCTELAQAYLENIKEKDRDIHAYLEVFGDVLEQAKKADERFVKKENVTLLTGIPIAVKDNILIKGRIASSASKMLENYHATYDATVIKKLKEAGAVFLGRTNMDEFAMGGSTENSAFGVTHNPHDLERVPGGSSGGSAAAVAADMTLVALGSDTGGSIRQPASFCGLVGLKPTYGAVSRYGVMAMGSSFDQIGPFAKTVEDAQILFDFIAGQDKMDSTSINCSKEDFVDDEIKYKIGTGFVIDSSQTDSLDWYSAVEGKIREADFIDWRGDDKSPKNLQYALATYYTLIPAEVSSNMARFDGVRYGLHIDGDNSVQDYFKTKQAGFGPEVKRRIILGTYILSSGYYDAYYNKANIVRDMIREEYNKAFTEVDILITPTTAGPAFKIGEKINDPLQLYLEDIFTVPANLAGIPAITVPCGYKEIDGKILPLGVQLMTKPGNEQKLFSVAKKIESLFKGFESNK